MGDQRAAKDLCLLSRLGVSAVVNCTPQLRDFHQDKLEYLRLLVGKWREMCGEDLGLLEAFLAPLLELVSRKVGWEQDKVMITRRSRIRSKIKSRSRSRRRSRIRSRSRSRIRSRNRSRSRSNHR